MIDITEASEKHYPVKYAFLKVDFFRQNFSDNAEELLDIREIDSKKVKRIYVIVEFENDPNTYLIPLRKNLDTLMNSRVKGMKSSYYQVPSSSYPLAGLDFRKSLVVNNNDFYEIKEPRLASSQKTIIEDNFSEISRLFGFYLKNYKKSLRKRRHKKDPLYKFCTLYLFEDEL